MPTTTNRYFVHPILSDGPTVATGTSAWVWTAWTEIAAANAITSAFNISAVSGMYDPANAALDIRHQFNVSLGKGAAASEVEIFQGAAAFYKDTAAGFVPHFYLVIPEPIQVAANTRIAVRVACSEAAARTTGGWKFQYSLV